MRRPTPSTVTVRQPSVLAIGAHPDDVELGSLGFLLLLSLTGARITFCVVTDGCRGGDAGTRRRESLAVAESLGAELIWGGLPDTRAQVGAAISLVEKAIAECESTLVLVHAPADTHQDHRVVARAVLSAARDVPNLFFYEGPTSRRFAPVGFVDVGSVMDRKLELIRSHDSQLTRRRYDDWARITAMYRGLATRPTCQYAEAFRPACQQLTTASPAVAESLHSVHLTPNLSRWIPLEPNSPITLHSETQGTPHAGER